MNVQRILLRVVGLLIVFGPEAIASAGFFSIAPGPEAKSRPAFAARSGAGIETYMVAYEMNPGAASWDIYVRALNASGATVGGPVNVSSVPPGYRASRPSVAFRSTSAGKTAYMVVWQLDEVAGTSPSTIEAVVLEVSAVGDIEIASGGALQVSFCGTAPAKDPDVAATTETPSCATLGDCIPYIVVYRCAPPNRQGTRSSVVKVTAVHAQDFISTDTAIAFSQGTEDSPAMAPHVAYGDRDLSNRYVLTYRALDGMGGAVVKGVEFDRFALSAASFYTEAEASDAPVVAFSKGAAAEGGGWTIVREIVVAGHAALVAQHFETGLGAKLGTYTHLAPVEDVFEGYRVTGSPNTSDFLLVFSQGNTLIDFLTAYAVQITGATASGGALFSAREFGSEVNQTLPSAAFQSDGSAPGAFVFGWQGLTFSVPASRRPGIRGFLGELP